ncbi:MAG: hypothetical protein AAGG50_20710, partial [Bacteroidota bacterium]
MSVRAKVITAPAAESRAFDVQEALADLKELLKPGISIFVVVVAAAGYLVGLGTAPIELSTLTALLTGVFMTAGG